MMTVMNRRTVGFAGAALALALAVSGGTPAAQSHAVDGHPDLQGTWYFGTATPLERPKEFEGKPFLTADEAADFERRTAERIARNQTVHPPEWLDYGTRVGADRRTSLIIDPPDGRVPALTAAARERAARRAQERQGPADGPEDLSVGERCLVFSGGPPILPGPYNNNLQIVQSPGSVVLHTEMIHDARVVPLDGRKPPPPNIRFWLGSSRGRWDGDTLVVETTNFTNQTNFRGSDEHLRVVERFTREGPNALRYEYTIDNPTAFTQPFTATFTMTRSTEMMYEFACHEGNYGMANILRAARFSEPAGASAR